VTGLLIVLAVLAVPYVCLNLRRLRRGRRWAFTVCQVAKEWDQRERAKLVAARAAQRVGTRAPDSRAAGLRPRS